MKIFKTAKGTYPLVFLNFLLTWNFILAFHLTLKNKEDQKRGGALGTRLNLVSTLHVKKKIKSRWNTRARKFHLKNSLRGSDPTIFQDAAIWFLPPEAETDSVGSEYGIPQGHPRTCRTSSDSGRKSSTSWRPSSAPNRVPIQWRPLIARHLQPKKKTRVSHIW